MRLFAAGIVLTSMDQQHSEDRTMRTLSLALSGAIALTAATAGSAAVRAEVAAEAAAPKMCISLNRIRNMEIVDSSNVLFHMNGDEHYLNELPYRCSGLYKNSPIMYQTSQNQLCNLDIITVLMPTGHQMIRGASCGLGQFRSVKADQIEALRETLKASRK